jgi:bleomycin hydrolase
MYKIKKNIMNKSIFFALSILSFLLISHKQIQAQDSTAGFVFDTIAMIPTTSVKSQYKSGTCWSYATTSFVETEIMRIDGKEYDLSEMYFVYYAYLDKAKSYIRLHGIANFSPGGQAHDVLDVIREHGIATQEAYPGKIKGYDKEVHGELNAGLEGFLKAVAKKKDKYLSQNWYNGFETLLTSYMGTVPEKTLETKFNVDDYVELTSYMYKPFYEPFRLEVPDNWSFNTQYYNLPINELMEVMNNALNNNYSVCWDGDVSSPGFSHPKALAILPETDVENLQGTEQSKWVDMSKKELMKNMFSFESPVPEKNVSDSMRQLDFDIQRATDDHLMHFTGLLKDQNGTTYYVTKNSWGTDLNDNGGYLNMSESYVRMNTIAIMVHKDAIPKAIRKKLNL